MSGRVQVAVAAAGHFAAAHWRWRMLAAGALAGYQDRRARAAVRLAVTHSPFYRDLWQGHDLDDWRTLPTVDKAAMMANFDRFNTLGVRCEDALAVAQRAEQARDFAPRVQGVTVGLSSGTSGHRGLFLVSPQEQATWAGVILARALHSVRPRTRVAFFLRSNSNLYAQANGLLINLRYFDLTTPLNAVCTALDAYRPHLIVGPPSLLGQLAAAQQADALHVWPQRLLAVAEVLEPQDAAALTQAFAAPVHQIYQCTEGLLAISCPHGSLHLQEDIVAVQCEPLPSDGSGVERVTPIVTDLWRRTQPILRYRLGDILQVSQCSCPCGSPFRVIERIEGRLGDECWLTTPDGARRPLYPDTLRQMVLGAAPENVAIEDYLVQQQTSGALTISLQVRTATGFATAANAVRAAVMQGASACGCLPPIITVQAGIPARPAWLKRRRLQGMGAMEPSL